MTLSELNTLLQSIEAFTGKVAYRAFPYLEAPALPYICYYATGSDNFAADNTVYHSETPVRIELYEKEKDLTTESSVEELLTSHDIFWEREETYVDDQNCYLIIYEVTI